MTHHDLGDRLPNRPPVQPSAPHPKNPCIHCHTFDTASNGQKPSVSTHGHIAITPLHRTAYTLYQGTESSGVLDEEVGTAQAPHFGAGVGMKFMAVPGVKCIPIMSNSATATCFSQ